MYLVALFLSTACFIGVLAAFLRSRYFSIFHPLTVYCAFHGFLFVLRPWFAQWLNYTHIYRLYQFTPSLSDKITVIYASNLGFLVFAFCCMRQASIPMRFVGDAFSVAERNRLAQLFPWVAGVCIPIAAWSLLRSWNEASQFVLAADMAFDHSNGTFINTTRTGYSVEAQMMLPPIAAIFAWLLRFRLWALVPLLTFVVMRAGTGGRGPFITALATVGLLYLYEQRRKFPTPRVMVAMVALVVAFSAVGVDRGQAIRVAFGEQADTRGTYFHDDQFLEGMDFGNLEYFEYIVYAVPQRSGTYAYFNGVLQLFTEPVPRILWKDKPVGAPFQTFYLFDYGYPVGMTKSLPGEGWFSLGWLGVAIWCGLWGWILGWIYRRFVQGPQNTLQTVSYMIFLPILIIAFRDGQIATVFRQGIFFFAPILLWSLFARYLHIPGAGEVRDQLGKAWRNRRTQPRPLIVVPVGGSLPPAVQRRRLALMAEPQE